MDTEKKSMQAAYGLTGIRERVKALNGKVSIEGVPGKGTTIKVMIADKIEETQ